MLDVPSADKKSHKSVDVVRGDALSKKQSDDRFRNKFVRPPMKLPHEVPAVLESLRIPALEHRPEDIRHKGLSLKKPSKGALVMLEFYRARSVPGYRRDHTKFEEMRSPPREVGAEPGVVGSGGTTSQTPPYQGGGSLGVTGRVAGHHR